MDQFRSTSKKISELTGPTYGSFHCCLRGEFKGSPLLTVSGLGPISRSAISPARFTPFSLSTSYDESPCPNRVLRRCRLIQKSMFELLQSLGTTPPKRT